MAKGTFNLLQMLNNNSKPAGMSEKDQVEPGADTRNLAIQMIHFSKLVPSEDNFYNTDNIADLMDSIEVIGIKQPVIVKPIAGTDQYKIIAGHRRVRACSELVAEGKTKFEYVPCLVESNIDELTEKIMLIYTNSTTRELSTWEKIEQLNQLKALFQEYKRTHEIPGRIRELLAEALDVSPSQVYRMETINADLLPELKEELKKDSINFSTAAELARLSVADQKALYEQHKETGVTDLNTVRAKKVKANKPKNQESINPTIEAMKFVRVFFERELVKIKPENTAEITITSEYYRILKSKADEVDRELFQLMGSDMFKGSAGAAEQEA